MDEESAVEDEEKPKQLHLAYLLLISVGLFIAAYTIDETFRWSDPLEGFMNGLIHGALFTIPLLILFLPWSLLIVAVYASFGWRRYRTHVVLAPIYLLSALSVIGLIVQPPTAVRSFEGITGVDWPDNAQQVRRHFRGGGFADYTYLYSMETTPDEVERLILELDLGDGSHLLVFDGAVHSSVDLMPGGPDFRKWPGATEYRRWDYPREGWFCYLITDESRTKVYIMIGCT